MRSPALGIAPNDRALADDVAVLVHRIACGDEPAVAMLWRAYFPALLRVLGMWFGKAPRPVVSEEDLAVNVMDTFCRRVQQGSLLHITTRGELWCILYVAAKREFLRHRRRTLRLKNGGGRSALSPDLDNLAARPSAAALSLEAAEEAERLVELLALPELKSIARLLLAGQTTYKIANLLGLPRRTVSRRIAMIRRHWQKRLG
jgi:DNA-directed RNA polymerase specialized sigma24 family protein